MRNLYYKNSTFAIYNDDNLNTMRYLPDNYISLIYGDILYGTGKKFKDYDDIKAEKDTVYSFYIPRFKQMKRLLRDDGTIFIQMDSRISHWVRCILDDIFGYDNFINEIIWHYSKMNAVTSSFISNHDNIFSYGKSKSNRKFNIQYNNQESALKTRLKKFIDNDNTIKWKSIKNHSSQLLDNYIKSAKNKLNKIQLDDDDIVIDFKTKENQKMDDVWDIPIIKGNSKEYIDYNTQKPMALLDNIILSSSDENDIVADFFMGSGSFGESALKNNRKFLGCDINLKGCQITKERLLKYE